MSAGSEKRKSVRVPVRFAVRLVKAQVENSGTALNLSIEGLFIQIPQPMIPFETWDIHFILPGSKDSMKIKARVMWSARVDVSGFATFGAGFLFEQTELSQTNELRKFIHYLLQS